MITLNKSLSGSTRFLLNAGAAVGLAAYAIPSLAQAGEVPIYKGEPFQQGGLQAGSWGSGEVKATTDFVYTGSNSIKVTTHGRYQGARLLLGKPTDLNSAQGEKSAYLQFIFMLPDKNGAGRMGGEGGMAGMAGMMGGRGGRGGGGPGGIGGPGGSGGRGGPGGGGEGATTLAKPKPLANFRIVFVTNDNKRTELQVPIENARPERETWQSFAIPIAAIPGLRETNGQLKEIQLFGDSPSILYLGEVRVVRDETPIRLDDLDDITIAKNDPRTFTAAAEAGPTPLRYEWAIQGIAARDGDPQEVTATYQVVGEGRTFTHKFVKSGDYVVTLTVSDLYGIKKPASKKMNVHVTL